MRRRPTIDDVVARMKEELPPELRAYVDWWARHNARAIRMAIDRRMKAGDVRVVEYLDYFKLNDAPFDWEERTSASGLSTYTVKVYRPEAYTNEYMHVSDESGRLVRWGVRLDDGRVVSRDGLIRLRFPERWDEIRKVLARHRGAKRDEVAARIIWDGMTADEREAVVGSVDLAAFSALSTPDAEKAIRKELSDSGSILAHVDDVPWFDMVRQHKAMSLTDVRLHDFVNFKMSDAGAPQRFRSDQAVADAFLASPLVVRGTLGLTVAPIARAVGDYAMFRSQHDDRRAGIELMRPLVLARLGGPWDRLDEEAVSKYDPSVRRRQIEAIDKRVARMQLQEARDAYVPWASWMPTLLQHLRGYNE